MRRDRHRDEEVAGSASAGEPLALQADGLAVVQPGRDFHLDLSTGRQFHALVRPDGCLRQRDRKRRTDVLARAGEILPLETGRPPRTRRAAECLLQNILERAEAAKSAATARVLKAVAPPAEGFESLGVEATLPAAAGETFKALETRLAFRVDLATIEGLAFFLLAEDFVSRVEFRKAPRRPRVVLIGVRMQLLRLPAEGALDLRGARG